VYLTQIDLADVLAQGGAWDEASELLERALDSARASSADEDKRARGLRRAAEVFDAHGDGPRASALVEEARAASAAPTGAGPR